MCIIVPSRSRMVGVWAREKKNQLYKSSVAQNSFIMVYRIYLCTLNLRNISASTFTRTALSHRSPVSALFFFYIRFRTCSRKHILTDFTEFEVYVINRGDHNTQLSQKKKIYIYIYIIYTYICSHVIVIVIITKRTYVLTYNNIILSMVGLKI